MILLDIFIYMIVIAIIAIVVGCVTMWTADKILYRYKPEYYTPGIGTATIIMVLVGDITAILFMSFVRWRYAP